MGTANEGLLERIELAKGQAEALKGSIGALAALDPEQAQMAQWSLLDMQEWLHGLWMEAAEQGKQPPALFRGVFMLECKRCERHRTPDRAEERGRRFFMECGLWM